MNIQIITKRLAVLLAIIGLTACGSSLDCNDKAKKEEALKIIQSHLNAAVWYNEMKMAIKGEPTLNKIKTIELDKERKQAECKGSYNYTYNEKDRSIDFAYYLDYLEDKKETEVKVTVQDVQAGLMSLVMFERPIKNGEEIIYNQNRSAVIAIRNWKANREHGVQQFFKETGSMIREYNSVNGVKDGTEKIWLDGELFNEVNWNAGKATGSLALYDDAPFIPTQYPYTIFQLKDGIKIGEAKTYDQSSKREKYLREILKFEDNELNGSSKQLSEEGHVIALFNYKQGKLDGHLQLLNDSGEVVYEILTAQGQPVFNDPKTAFNLDTCMEEGKKEALIRGGSMSWGKREVSESSISRIQADCSKGVVPTSMWPHYLTLKPKY